MIRHWLMLSGLGLALVPGGFAYWTRAEASDDLGHPTYFWVCAGLAAIGAALLAIGLIGVVVAEALAAPEGRRSRS